MEKTAAFEILENEYWYGACAQSGFEMPFGRNTVHSVKLEPNTTPNQASPLIVSNMGRFIWSDSGFNLDIKDGKIKLTYIDGEPKLYEGYKTLKGAYCAAQEMFFAPSKKVMPKEFFAVPQYNTWIEIMYEQTQDKILNYAEGIIKAGYPAGVLMIDDCWSKYYGAWEFDPEHFSDPKAMVDKLHEMGFKVMLWICPFISADSKECRMLEAKGALVKDKNGDVSVKKWWNGYSAVLDFTSLEAVKWYLEVTRKLMDDYGIDGFKMDAGDAYFYSRDDVTYSPTTPNIQSELWAKMALNFDYNELRACWKNGGQPLMQRLADKGHNWGNDGVAALIPNELAQGIIGHAFTCPDMIGGGQFVDFLPGAVKFSEELFVRYAQIAALMPMMQFSASPWRVLSDENKKIVYNCAKLHEKFGEKIWEYAKHAAETGEPIVRYMEYVFPHCGMEKIIDQFMLGDDVLVAPATKNGQRDRTVTFPEGTWISDDGKEYTGPTSVEIDVPLARLPYFVKKK